MATSKWLNPAFDSRILSIGTHNKTTPLKRGYILLDKGGAPPGMGGKGIRFLYNPVAASVSHTIDPNNLVNGATQQSATAKGQTGTFVNIGSVSVDLLYDRTYELWDSSKKHTLAGQYGVYADVLAFYEMTGIVRSVTTASSGPARGGFTPSQSGFEQFPHYPPNPAGRYYLYFGDKMRWYGTLTDLSITYSHWTQNMIPSRCTVSVGLMFQTDSSAGAGLVTKGGKVVPKGSPKIPGAVHLGPPGALF